MASTGFVLAGTGANVDDATGPWASPGNITANDNVYSTTAEASSTTVDKLRATNFGFAIPAGSTIDGVETRHRRFHDGGGLAVSSTVVGLCNSGALIGTAKTTAGDWATSEEVSDKGTSADTWSATLDATVVNSSTFGCQMHLVWAAGIPGEELFAKVDSVEMNITYTEPSGPPAGTLAMMGCGR